MNDDWPGKRPRSLENIKNQRPDGGYLIPYGDHVFFSKPIGANWLRLIFGFAIATNWFTVRLLIDLKR